MEGYKCFFSILWMQTNSTHHSSEGLFWGMFVPIHMVSHAVNLCPQFLGDFLPEILDLCVWIKLFILLWMKVLFRKTNKYISPAFQPTHLPYPLGHRLMHVLALPNCATTFTPGCWNLCTHPSLPPTLKWHHVDADNAVFNLHMRPAHTGECLLGLLPAS